MSGENTDRAGNEERNNKKTIESDDRDRDDSMIRANEITLSKVEVKIEN